MMDHPEIFLFQLLFEDMNDFLGFFALSLKKMDIQKNVCCHFKRGEKNAWNKISISFRWESLLFLLNKSLLTHFWCRFFSLSKIFLRKNKLWRVLASCFFFVLRQEYVRWKAGIFQWHVVESHRDKNRKSDQTSSVPYPRSMS